jgi:hypothetical protein
MLPATYGLSGPGTDLHVAVCMYGRHARAYEGVCVLHHGGDRTQAADRNYATRHQPEVIPLLHVQSGACPLCQRESPLLSSTDENSSDHDNVGSCVSRLAYKPCMKH